MSGAGTALLRLGTAALRRAAAGGPPQAQASAAGARRAFGAGTKGSTYEGVTIHEPEAWQTNLANGVTALMWYGTAAPPLPRPVARRHRRPFAARSARDPSPRSPRLTARCVPRVGHGTRARRLVACAQVLDPPPRQE